MNDEAYESLEYLMVPLRESVKKRALKKRICDFKHLNEFAFILDSLEQKVPKELKKFNHNKIIYCKRDKQGYRKKFFVQYTAEPGYYIIYSGKKKVSQNKKVIGRVH